MISSKTKAARGPKIGNSQVKLRNQKSMDCQMLIYTLLKDYSV